MTSFVVLSHNGQLDDKHTEKVTFVRDSFAVWALAFPIIWLVWHRLWFHATIAFLISVLIAMMVQSPMLIAAVLPMNLLLGLLIALEGPAWRVGGYKNNGYVERGVVLADTVEEAQILWALGDAHESLEDRKAVPNHSDLQVMPLPAQNLIFGGTDR